MVIGMAKTKQKKIDDKLIECPECNKSRDLKKEIFWCPRLRTTVNDGVSGYMYGQFTCIHCCREKFFDNIHSIHSSGGFAVGSCHNCDFPIGAILFADAWYEKPEDKEHYLIQRTLNDKTDHVFTTSFGFREYYWGYKWDDGRGLLKVVPKIRCDGVQELLLKHRVLPKRIIITVEDLSSRLPLMWSDFTKYYWVDCGHSQHFDEEEWMDGSPVVLLPMYLNGEGAVMEGRVKGMVEAMVKKLNPKSGKKKKEEK